MAFHHCNLVPSNSSFCFNGTLSSAIEVTHFEVAVELYIISVLCLVGIFGNVVSVVVLRRDKERREALFLLQALAVADCLYLVVGLLHYPLKHLVTDSNVSVTMQLYVFPLLKTAQAICIWMMVLVTVDRYIYVCVPLRAHQLFNRRNRRVFAALTFLLGFVYTLPRFFDSCIFRFMDGCTGTTLSKVVYRPAFFSKLYINIYQYAMYLALLYVGPLTTLLVLNVRLIRAIRRSRRRHRAISAGSEYNENNATLVLVILVVVFIVCESPELALKLFSIITLHVKSEVEFSAPVVRFHTVTELLMILNSSTNFFIYCAFGKRFRKVMRETFQQLSYNTTLVTHESVPLQQHNNLNQG